MLQASFLNVSSVFSNVCYKCIYLDIAYVFIHMMQAFYLDVAYVYNIFKYFSGVFASVSDACFKCFICFQTYVAIVAYGCFKTRSGVTFYYLTSTSGVGSEGKRRWSLLAWAVPRACTGAQQLAACEAAPGGHVAAASGHAAASGVGWQAQ